MPRAERYVLPIALVAGVLSGSLFRIGPTAKSAVAAESVEGARAGDSGPGGLWLADLRPVMRSLEGALGVPPMEGDLVADLAHVSPAGCRATNKGSPGEGDDTPTIEALLSMDALRVALADPFASSCCVDETSLNHHARLLATALLCGLELAKTQREAADSLLGDYRDRRRLGSLVRSAKSRGFEVRLAVATIPDYVDSSSGWQADQSLAAIQSGMARANFVFDRMSLIDWSRSSRDGAAARVSDLHERQPGVLIFRSVQKDVVVLQLVLLVLETPTAGVHQAALRNSLNFILDWRRHAGDAKDGLRVLGPTFSGSIPSLAKVLAERSFTDDFSDRLVITGSANADGNAAQMNQLSGGAIYRATVQPISVLEKAMALQLGTMNPVWRNGQRIALLQESNTAYGQGSTATGTHPFADASTFAFPLHVAQLRSDAPAAAPPSTALLQMPIVPLDMRETMPPSDLIPALRPQMTSPVVEATVGMILDAIRHEQFSAVGIKATDDRDVLFLAREVKRAAPDVQLFLFGAHALYLHPEYVPYLRGALVASPYSLSLANQPEIGAESHRRREPFQNMSAEGIMRATVALMAPYGRRVEATGESRLRVPYCQDGRDDGACVPVSPATVNVIGEDGYWTVAAVDGSDADSNGPAVGDETSPMLAMPPPLVPRQHPLPPLPLRVLVAAFLLGAAILCHFSLAWQATRRQAAPPTDRALMPALLRPFVAPDCPAAASSHSLAGLLCIVLLALTATWAITIVVPFLPSPRPVVLLASVSVGLLGVGITVAPMSHRIFQVQKMREYQRSTPAPDAGDAPSGATWLARLFSQAMLVAVSATLVLFAVVTLALMEAGFEHAAGKPSVLSRVVGGGIVSPAVLTLCLVGSLYTALLAALRRLSFVGRGYAALSAGSATFCLLGGGRPQGHGAADRAPLAGLLDQPAQHLPRAYLIIVITGLTIAGLGMLEVSTIDGLAFTRFVVAGSLTSLGLGSLLLAHGLSTWRAVQANLRCLVRSGLYPHFKTVASVLAANLPLTPPRLEELGVASRMADRLLHDLRVFRASADDARGPFQGSRQADGAPPEMGPSRTRLMREGDFPVPSPTSSDDSYLGRFEKELEQDAQAPIIQTQGWFDQWKLADDLTRLLQRTHWRRGSTLPEACDRGKRDPISAEAEWFARCEQFVALQIAFALRDTIARVIAALFVAMVCLSLLTTGHLLYAFNGRATLLTIDLVAVAAAALLAVWILVDMERDDVLSALRRTTPGRIDLNWEFLKRIGLYGVLPLLAVVASVFPEIGGTVFGWLEPLRQFSNF